MAATDGGTAAGKSDDWGTTCCLPLAGAQNSFSAGAAPGALAYSMRKSTFCPATIAMGTVDRTAPPVPFSSGLPSTHSRTAPLAWALNV